MGDQIYTSHKYLPQALHSIGVIL